MSERARILLLSPLPPPSGGISNWTAAVLASDLAERFELRVASSSPASSSEVAGASRPSLSRALDMSRILGRFALELARGSPQGVHVNTLFLWGLLRDDAEEWMAKRARSARRPSRLRSLLVHVRPKHWSGVEIG